MPDSKKVLIIDDDLDTRFALRAILNYYDYHVLEAGDGVEGVNVARRDLPDVIVMDLHMPRLNGWEAAEALHQDERTRGIPIVVVTGDWEAAEEGASRRRVFHSWLRKPLEPRALKDHIGTITGGP